MYNWKNLYEKEHVLESAYELPFILFPEDSLVLDIGCGRGRQMKYLKSKYGSMCIGIDIVPSKLPYFLVADACVLPFRDKIFDISYSLGVVEHLKQTQVSIKESKRVLNFRGQCLHSVPNMFSLHTFIERPLTNLLFTQWSVGFEKSFTPKKIIQMFVNSGFRNIKQKIVIRPGGESKIHKLNIIESFFYIFLKEIDRFFYKIFPKWGFFIYTYARI